MLFNLSYSSMILSLVRRMISATTPVLGCSHETHRLCQNKDLVRKVLTNSFQPGIRPLSPLLLVNGIGRKAALSQADAMPDARQFNVATCEGSEHNTSRHKRASKGKSKPIKL